MNLNAFASDIRRRLFEDLEAGRLPSIGEFSEEGLAVARSKGKPQMGSTRYRPDRIGFEFIYPDPRTASAVFKVEVESPERIVFMPVPSWVIEQIWQGEVTGSFHFESDANTILSLFASDLSKDKNLQFFG